MNIHEQSWRATAPGSLMVMGEHAVLHGKRALVCAVDRFMQVTICPRSDRVIRVTSVLGEDQCELDAIPVREPFRFVWSAVAPFAGALHHGFDLAVDSDFSHEIGFGSSAAVTVATIAALNEMTASGLHLHDVHRRSLDVIRAVQGRGSGADAAASVFGGLVEYRADPRQIEPLHAIHPITVVYAGYKMPTPEVIRRVEMERAKRPALFAGFFFEIDDCVRDAVDAICRDEWPELGRLMNRNHALMDALGVNDPTLERIATALREQSGILGAKISGSGLGDCVVGLGHADEWELPYERIPCAMTGKGVRVEEV